MLGRKKRLIYQQPDKCRFWMEPPPANVRFCFVFLQLRGLGHPAGRAGEPSQAGEWKQTRIIAVTFQEECFTTSPPPS